MFHYTWDYSVDIHSDGLLELRLSCTNPSIWFHINHNHKICKIPVNSETGNKVWNMETFYILHRALKLHSTDCPGQKETTRSHFHQTGLAWSIDQGSTGKVSFVYNSVYLELWNFMTCGNKKNANWSTVLAGLGPNMGPEQCLHNLFRFHYWQQVL